MKPRQSYAVLILFLFTSGSLTFGTSEGQQRDENEAIILIPKKFDYAIGSPKRTQFVSIYDKARQITGDTAFSRTLEQEVLQEEQRRRAMQQSKEASFPYSSFFVPILLAFANNGFATSFQDTFKKSTNVLVVAWLPVLFLNATWIEMISVALLLVRPAVWSFLVNDFFTDTWAILKKLLLSELWRHFWKHATKIVPMPILSPSAEYLKFTPDWFQTGFSHAKKVVDKFVQGLLRKSIERCFQESLGIAVGAISESFPERGHKLLGLDKHDASGQLSPSETEVEEMVVQRDIESDVPVEDSISS
mmetsp:Transcript_39885/g.96228  ORF Transcript_39885/g.96228 Transcript_39885/m.96228 type:complete len:304 (-) Transcript_39885:787-1698(-)